MEFHDLRSVTVAILMAAGWPQWLGPHRDAISDERGADRLAAAPRRLWAARVGVGPSSPVESGGRVFAAGHAKAERNRGTDTVFALDAATGSVLWSRSFPAMSCATQDVKFDGPRATPTVDDGRVFVLSLDGRLSALAAESGDMLWSRDLVGELGGSIPVYGYACSPLVCGNLLLVEVNARTASAAAFEKSTGSVVWRSTAPSVTCGSPVLARMDGRDCAVFAGAGAVVGLDPESGAERWRHGTFGHMWMGPVVSGNTVFIADASLPRGCGAIRIEGGRPRLLWRDGKKYQTLHTNAVIWGGHIYGTDNTGTDYQGSDSKKSSLKCVELETGTVRWVAGKMGWANLILFDGKLIILRECGELVIADATPAGYRERGRAEVLGGKTWTVPALSGGRLYVKSNAGEIAGLDLFGGEAPPSTEKPRIAGDGSAAPNTAGGLPVAGGRAPGAPAAIPAPVEGKAPGPWPRFRGPGGLAVAPYDDVPVSFDGRSGRNVLWKVPVPLPGPSSPIVLGNTIFLAGADHHRREVMAFDADSGKVRWRREVKAPGSVELTDEDKVIAAAATPATDGERVYAIFANGDLAATDLAGNVVWTRSLGRPDDAYGHASSLDVARGLLLVQLDQGGEDDGKSRLLAVEAKTGKTAWEAKRAVRASWSTPLVIGPPGREQVVACGGKWTIAYDLATGSEAWRAKNLGGEVVPAPVFADGLVFSVAVDGRLAAIRPGGSGDVTATHIAWSVEDDLPGITSPIAASGMVVIASSGGLVACYEAATGRKLWEKDFETNFQPSPVLAGGVLRFLDENGVLFAFKMAGTYEAVGRSELGEPCLASPALAPGRMYIRSRDHLWAIGKGD